MLGLPLRSHMMCLAALATVSVMVASCGTDNGPGALFVDPGRYDAYHCNDLAARWKALLEREKQLRNLIDRAQEGSGGALIGTMAYGPDYDSVLTEKKLVQRRATELKCELVPVYQSDQTIR